MAEAAGVALTFPAGLRPVPGSRLAGGPPGGLLSLAE